MVQVDPRGSGEFRYGETWRQCRICEGEGLSRAWANNAVAMCDRA